MTITDPEPVDPYRRPKQWTRADLAAATARGDHERIVQAQNAGQLEDLLTGADNEGESS